MLGAAAVTAQFVGGKAARDALFLGSLGFTALPTMVIATAAVSIMLLAVSSRYAHKISPATLVPAAFTASGVLLLLEWWLTYKARSLGAIVVYLHISALGPLLGSWFWLIVSERFDPRTAKRHLGGIAGAGTLGGLLSALLAERVGAAFGVAAMLPFLAAFHFFSAWQVRRLAVQSEAAGRATALEPDPVPTLSGWRVFAEAPYLRRLATLVLLGATSAALVDYLFKAEAVKVFGRGDALLRFFAIYYAATSLIAFVIQTSSSRATLERFGLALTTSTPSFALLGGGIGGLIAPGLGSLVAARGGESVLRSSLLRSGYELFYTPIPAEEMRAAKASVDVGVERLGDALGGGLVRGVLLLAPALQYPVILSMGMACSAAAIVAASRLTRGYIHTLEKSLLNRAVEIDLSDTVDGTTRMLLMKTLGRPPGPRTANQAEAARRADAMTATALDPEIQQILWLRSRDRARVAEVLRREEGLTPALVPHAIQLLAWDPVAADAVFALRKVAAERAGELIDALVDPNQDLAVRRRLARVFTVCASQRGRRSASRPRRPSLRGALSVRAVVGRDVSEESRPPLRQRADLRGGRAGDQRRSSHLGEPSPARRDRNPAGRAVCGRIRADQGRPESDARVHAAHAGAPGAAAADCVSKPAHRRCAAARYGARIPGRRTASTDSRPCVAIPRGSRSREPAYTAARRNPRRPHAVKPLNHGEPRGLEAACRHAAGGRRHGKASAPLCDDRGSGIDSPWTPQPGDAHAVGGLSADRLAVR
jgi:ATP:ADP antiporter, AAA family